MHVKISELRDRQISLWIWKRLFKPRSSENHQQVHLFIWASLWAHECRNTKRKLEGLFDKVDSTLHPKHV